jgi:cell division protein FtsQ
MYNPQPANTVGSLKRKSRLFSRIRVPSAGKYMSGGKKKATVEHQYSWQMKKVSQKVMLWLLLMGFVFCLAWLFYTMLLRSDIFRMTSVSVQGNKVTTQQQILAKAGLHGGRNLLTLDVSQIKSLILQEQWIEEVSVNRHWPSTVEIVIREYKPFALINLERDGTQQLYYINNKGIIFAPSSAEKDLDYPVVNGSGLADDLLGKRFQKDSLGSMALDFLKLTARGNQILPIQAVSEINVDPELGLIVYLVDHPFPIYMGKDDIRLRFGRLVRVLAKLYKDDEVKGVAEIRMDYGDNKILVARVEGAI